jgi:class 3 adenylate cyclase
VAVQPKGTPTLLFSDIQGSTSLLEQLGPEQYAEVLEVNRRLLREAFDEQLRGR